MEWRRRSAGDYAAGPDTWGRATILKSARGWSVRVWAYGLEDGLLEDSLKDAKATAESIRNALYRRSQAGQAGVQ